VIFGWINRTVAIRHDRRRYLAGSSHDPPPQGLPPVARCWGKLARTFLDAVTVAAIYAFWL
jgi:hypothetical protein